ncbi:MAG: hypoxanthine phosphoribosyltransferase [Acidobacteria bacterium]|nr:hypoxanthine phosphoribosyltransferase [Acidobacteriota bacterium]
MSSLQIPYYVWKTEQQIQERVRELAGQIEADFAGDQLYVLGILRGCFVFMADLIRNIELDVFIHFINLYYRDVPMEHAGMREVEETVVYPSFQYEGKNILIVGSVLDTGVVNNHLLEQIRVQQPRKLRLAMLIDKKFMRKVDLRADYVAFEDERNDYIFGYGLEYGESQRNLPYLAKLK